MAARPRRPHPPAGCRRSRRWPDAAGIPGRPSLRFRPQPPSPASAARVTASMNPAPEERRLGEYRLRELLSETYFTRSWLAEQTSIARRVLLEELKPDHPGEMEIFLADIRAKAAVDHPLIGSIYEASAEPGQCFYAHELLPGATLASRIAAGGTLPPARLAHVLRRVSEAQLQHESMAHATSPLGPEAIHLDEHGVTRLDNLAIAGSRAEETSYRDISHLGSSLVPLVSQGVPGATRVLTLLGWMRGEGLEAPLTWAQIRDLGLQIEHQLADPLSIVSPKGQKKKRSVTIVAVLTGLALVGIITLAMKVRPPAPPPPPRASLPGPVAIPAGTYPTPDGTKLDQPAFSIASHETTIGEYAEFLSTLAVLAKNQREKLFDHVNQPAEKANHEPEDWDEVLAEAKASGTWKGQSVTVDSPVTGIDWWDASAYAEWKKGRLPTQEEWFAALSHEVKNPSALTPSPYEPVTPETTDRTPPGMLGMAGSLCEWTAKAAPNPANLLGEKLWVIIGGSYLKAGSNALTREWTADRNLRRADLGFRVLLPAE
ncbi:MAG: hypothetical protein EOP88_11315 [Verrucomicrobiaceae bacterium]|nr:MAG: hypothetical protein EOP88_11315 [Verrucomicrobiaceae bacterium]